MYPYDTGQRLVFQLTEFNNLCLAGDVPTVIRPVFFGASLCTLTRKDGDIRPIVHCRAIEKNGFQVSPREDGSEDGAHAAVFLLEAGQGSCGAVLAGHATGIGLSTLDFVSTSTEKNFFAHLKRNCQSSTQSS